MWKDIYLTCLAFYFGTRISVIVVLLLRIEVCCVCAERMRRLVWVIEFVESFRVERGFLSVRVTQQKVTILAFWLFVIIIIIIIIFYLIIV
jgi:hypothetical protein